MKLILLDGPPGSGKTSLAEALVKVVPGSVLLLEMDPHHPLHPVPVGDIGADFSDLAIESIQDLADLLVTRWAEFLESSATEITLILESYPFQSHHRVLWQFGATQSEILEFQARVIALLAPHSSLLVQLDFQAYDLALPLIFQSRGEDWVEFIEEFFQSAPIGEMLALEGKSSAAELLEEYAKALRSWFAEWNLRKVSVNAWTAAPDVQAQAIFRSL